MFGLFSVNFTILAENTYNMSIFRLPDPHVKTAAVISTAIFLCLSALYFLPPDIPCKLSFPLAALAAASLWLCPWKVSLALFFSALGDLAGSLAGAGGVMTGAGGPDWAETCFMLQMGSFLCAHIFFIWFFAERYFAKVEHDRKLTGKAKGYLAMVVFCIIGLLAIAFTRIIPDAPAGLIRTGAGLYAVIICLMLLTAMLQRSSLYALGALLFVFSDFILSWNRFVEPVPYADLLILIPYFLGQWLIFIRSTSFRIAPEMRIMRF